MKDQSPEWRRLYEAALVELDRDRLLERIEVAEMAIRDRQKATEPDQRRADETQAIEDALHALSLLRRSALKE